MKDASQLLGSRQLAGTTVNPRGYGWKAGTDALPLLGEAVAGRVDARSPDTSQTPTFPRIAFLAVTDQEVALVALGSGGFNGILTDTIARVPRDQVASARVGRGVLRCGVTIEFANGGSWELEVSRLIRSKATRVVRALGF